MPIPIQLFRKEKGGDPDKVRESQRRRFKDVGLVDVILKLDEEWRALVYAHENLKKDMNAKSKNIGTMKKAGQDTSAIEAEIRELKKKHEQMVAETDAKERERDNKLKQIGNIVHDSVPVSKDEKDNIIYHTHGQITKPKRAELLHHHELLAMIDGYASEQGAAIAGHRAYYLKGPGVMLNQALINYGLNFLMKHGYTPLQPPFFMNKDVMAETAQLEEFDEALYKVTGNPDEEEKYLIATSEQPISAFHRGEWLNAKDLPLKYAGISSCFRKEAGSHGRDAWGIFRIHQFEKVEQFVLTEPDKSWEAHEDMIKVSGEFFASLGFHYRVVNIVSGELNNAAAKKYDLEAWFPTLGVYRELVSASNCTDYQSRAMGTRFGQNKQGDNEKLFVHMLNATLCATERTICCILENYQTEDGVVVPEVLRPYMGGKEFLPFVKPRPKNVNKSKSEKGAQAAGSEEKKSE